MTVPALDTSKIGVFAYLQPATSIQLADALPYFHAYKQYSEYVDGVLRIWDTGSQSPSPNNYCDVYTRIRTDGWMMAFWPRDVSDPPASHNAWTLENYNGRGDLVWWGHVSSTTGNPPTNATRLGRALYELWEAVKENSDNPEYSFSYDDVGYYDYELTAATKIYIFGRSDSCKDHKYFYFTVPEGTNLQCAYINYGWKGGDIWIKINEDTEKEKMIDTPTDESNGYLVEDVLANIFTGGIQNVIHTYTKYYGVYTWLNTAMIIYADG